MTTIAEKRYDLQEYVRDTYDTNLPAHTSDADVLVLWEAANAMHEDGVPVWFTAYATAMFSGILYSTSVASDKIEQLKAELNELKAQNGYDVDARAS